jgi:signal transduction histidine kinase
MGRRGYGVRVGAHGGGEIAELGVAFNRMSEQIEDHDRVRDEFIANASHELKTPLSTMKLLSESILYQDNPDPALMKEFFTDVNSEVDRLSRIVTELLALVQNDVTDAAPELTYQRLDQLADETITRLKPLADHKGIKLVRELSPVSCMLEWTRMGQVVSNLVENAIKYTDEGSVFVSVTQDEDFAYLTVRDTGIGIPEESLPHLFERFYRVDKARSRGTGGTGLGLAIVEEIVLQHGGDIRVQSTAGKGSTFTVSLPRAHAQSEDYIG